jgi:hypothetical protein
MVLHHFSGIAEGNSIEFVTLSPCLCPHRQVCAKKSEEPKLLLIQTLLGIVLDCVPQFKGRK